MLWKRQEQLPKQPCWATFAQLFRLSSHLTSDCVVETLAILCALNISEIELWKNRFWSLLFTFSHILNKKLQGMGNNRKQKCRRIEEERYFEITFSILLIRKRGKEATCMSENMDIFRF